MPYVLTHRSTKKLSERPIERKSNDPYAEEFVALEAMAYSIQIFSQLKLQIYFVRGEYIK